MATPSETERVEEEEAAEPPSLDKLAEEILNIIVDALAAAEDVLQPRHLACLARSCKAMDAAVKADLRTHHFNFGNDNYKQGISTTTQDQMVPLVG